MPLDLDTFGNMSGYHSAPVKKRVVEEYKRQAEDSSDTNEGFYNMCVFLHTV